MEATVLDLARYRYIVENGAVWRESSNRMVSVLYLEQLERSLNGHTQINAARVNVPTVRKTFLRSLSFY